MWNKHINLTDARALSNEFCKDFDIQYCQIYMVDLLLNNAYGQYSYLNPPHILILDIYKNHNKIGVLMHELTHHVECYQYTFDYTSHHGYHYQLAKKKVIRWCEENISIKPDWKKTLSAYIDEAVASAFKI